MSSELKSTSEKHPTAVFPTPIDEHPVAVYLAGLSPSSRRTMLTALTTVAQIGLGDPNIDAWQLPWQRLRFQHTNAMRAALQEKYAPSTANRMLSALRGVLKAAWKLGLMSAEEYHKAVSVESIKGERVPAGRALVAGELEGLLATCDDTPLGVRDATILTLLYGCGLRRAELVALDLADYRAQAHELRVPGKGSKERSVPLGHVEPVLQVWLGVRGTAVGPLFWGLGNRNRGQRLTDQAIYNMLRKRTKLAGLPRLSPHDFRRTYVGDLLDAGADLATVQKMAGHADPATTSRYDRRGQRALHAAADLLKIPRRSES